MLGHYHVAGDNELVLYSDFFENFEKEIFATRRSEELPAVIATAGNEEEFSATMESLQSFWHGRVAHPWSLDPRPHDNVGGRVAHPFVLIPNLATVWVALDKSEGVVIDFLEGECQVLSEHTPTVALKPICSN